MRLGIYAPHNLSETTQAARLFKHHLPPGWSSVWLSPRHDPWAGPEPDGCVWTDNGARSMARFLADSDTRLWFLADRGPLMRAFQHAGSRRTAWEQTLVVPDLYAFDASDIRWLNDGRISAVLAPTPAHRDTLLARGVHARRVHLLRWPSGITPGRPSRGTPAGRALLYLDRLTLETDPRFCLRLIAGLLPVCGSLRCVLPFRPNPRICRQLSAMAVADSRLTVCARMSFTAFHDLLLTCDLLLAPGTHPVYAFAAHDARALGIPVVGWACGGHAMDTAVPALVLPSPSGLPRILGDPGTFVAGARTALERAACAPASDDDPSSCGFAARVTQLVELQSVR